MKEYVHNKNPMNVIDTACNRKNIQKQNRPPNRRKGIVTKILRNRKNRHNTKCSSQHLGQAKTHLEDQNGHKKPQKVENTNV
jgi:hypothetical protein